jgi:hypothetical protein
MKHKKHEKSISLKVILTISWFHHMFITEMLLNGLFKLSKIISVLGYVQHTPMHLWDILITQAVLTLNMMRASIIKISAATQYEGVYEFNRAPFASPCTRIISHKIQTNGGRGYNMSKWMVHGVCKGTLKVLYSLYLRD